jgi:hypothetical protein
MVSWANVEVVSEKAMATANSSVSSFFIPEFSLVELSPGF